MHDFEEADECVWVFEVGEVQLGGRMLVRNLALTGSVLQQGGKKGRGKSENTRRNEYSCIVMLLLGLWCRWRNFNWYLVRIGIVAIGLRDGRFGLRRLWFWLKIFFFRLRKRRVKLGD